MFKGQNQYTKDKASDETRFLAKVDKKENGCWEWNSTMQRQGYGLFWTGGKAKNGGKYQVAHRYSYELHKEPIAEGMFILHSCDNPKCVNPAHLSQGTPKDNMDDMKNKGREKWCHHGEKNGACKLTEQKVREIREKFAKGDITMTKLGEEYGVGQQTISSIIKRKLWSHIPQISLPDASVKEA